MAPAGRSYEEILKTYYQVCGNSKSLLINSRFQIPIPDADQSLLSLIWNLKSGIWNYYGMAPAGRSYEEILKTYYQVLQIRKAY